MLVTVIGSNPERTGWAAEALASVPGEALVVSVPGFELGKLQWVLERTTLDRFLFIQDSVVVSPALYDLLSGFDGSVALLSDPRVFGCYLGVYERKVLERVGVPQIGSKREAVEAEIWWTQAYCQAAGDVPVLFPDLKDSRVTHQTWLHGRENLVLENEFMTKYKGTWRRDQIDS